jgi:nicotinamidase-related amidase
MRSKPRPPRYRCRIDHARAALLVMDFQKGIVERIGDDELVERAAAAIATARERDMQIAYVRVAFEDDDLAQIPETNKAFTAAAASLRNDAAETMIDERLTPQAGDIVVRKVRVGAFSTTDLHEQLRERGIDTLVLAGISTSGVVLSTIRDAADRDYRIYVLADVCADPDAEVHSVLMGKVFPRQAFVISASDL